MLSRLKSLFQKWLEIPNGTPSYMIYLGRDIPKESPLDFNYVTDEKINDFLNEQPYFDSFTIWYAAGAWKAKREDTVVVEVFDTELDIIKMFAQLYADTYTQEAVYIKATYTYTTLIKGEQLNASN